MFSGWQSFYQLTGAAAGELIGLLFIVATLTTTARRPDEKTELQGSGPSPAVSLFTTPVVFHLAAVLIVSALALAPDGERGSASLGMLAMALVGCAYTGRVAWRLGRIQRPTHWSDAWLYGIAPLAIYFALALATAAAAARTAHAAWFVGVILLALLVVAIRNAWDLVTWLAARRG